MLSACSTSFPATLSGLGAARRTSASRFPVPAPAVCSRGTAMTIVVPLGLRQSGPGDRERSGDAGHGCDALTVVAELAAGADEDRHGREGAVGEPVGAQWR